MLLLQAGRDLGRHARDSLDILDHSWAMAMANAASPDERHVPHDVDEAESIWDDSDDSDVPDTPISALAASVAAIGFDCSCLNDLDEQLLASPVDSFADICWSEAVDDDRFARPISRRVLRSKADLGLVNSEDSDTDSSRTFHDGPSSSSLDKVDVAAIALAEAHPQSFPSVCAWPETHFDDRYPRPAVVQPHFSTAGPKESIGFFPIPHSHHRGKSRNGPVGRIATFCTKLVKSS
ncbi:hypothetical protein HGRIS_001941 [Hohenbuehelia grisea]|uniref:Uncharacterized protein n=1 Tax=Hohenbuehelia grisea TaxID=104357 RepID=A0ABR3JIX7_9AGAR